MTKNKHFGFLIFDLIGHLKFGFRISQKGVTLLLVVLVLSAILSISLGIFDVVFGELRLSGAIADSAIALYAAGEAIERGLYEDRDATPLCFPSPGAGANCYDSGLVSLANGACYRLRADKTIISPTVIEVTLRATGEFRCGDEVLGMKRAFSVTYRVEE